MPPSYPLWLREKGRAAQRTAIPGRENATQRSDISSSPRPVGYVSTYFDSSGGKLSSVVPAKQIAELITEVVEGKKDKP